MSFKVTFEEFDFLKKQLKTSPDLNAIVPDVSLAILKFHYTLEDRVQSLYTAKDNLSSVLIGNSKQPSELGNTFLRYSLQYRDKPVKLSEYAYQENVVESETAKYPERMFDGGIKWLYKGYALQVKTEIRRGKPIIAKRGKNYTQKGFLQHGRILARKQKATWREYPTRRSDGVRAPIVELYGPSLSQLAESTYDKDSIVQNAKDTIGNDILNAAVKWYS